MDPESDAAHTFVLLHGSWLGGWMWDQVADRLRASGHPVDAPTLSGSGTLDQHVDEARACLAAHDRPVLVAYSYGGMVAAGAVAAAPGSVARVLFLDAFVPGPGQSAFAVLPAIQPLFEANAAASGGEHAVPVPPAMLGVEDPDLADRLLQRMRPWSVATHRAPSPGFPREVAATYLQLTGTPFFDELASALEEGGWPVERLDLPHLAPITHPDLVAAALLRHAITPEEAAR